MTNKIFPLAFWRSKERLFAAVILGVAMVIRVIDIFTRYFDSDEPQHLHVIWGWAHGYVQYRDVFDNHTPLFHMLFAPLFAVLPEWHGTLYIMRLAVLPFYLLTLSCTYLIGRRLFSPRTGLWAMVFLALYERFFIKMLEFRPDCLWTALLVLGIYLMVRRPLTRKSSFVTGVVFGAALAVSFKTMILLVALIISLPLAWAVAGIYSVPYLRKRLILCCYAIAGILVIPAVLVAFFYGLHALPDFYYGVIQHNAMAHGNSSLDYGFIKDKRVIQFMLWMTGTCGLAWYVGKVTQDAERKIQRVFVMATGMSYIAIIFAFWPIVTHQTQLPAFPLLIVSFTPLLTGDYSLLGNLFSRIFGKPLAPAVPMPVFFLVTIAIAELFMLMHAGSMVGRHSSVDPQVWKDVLKYTDPSDFVMDAKGETIFRKRPYFYGFETITMQLVASGVIPDNSGDSLIARPTYVVAAKNLRRYPGKLKAFVLENYLRAGTLFVAGKKLSNGVLKQGAPSEFTIAVPGRYAIVSSNVPVPGTMNGAVGNGVFDLKAGSQKFVVSKDAAMPVIIWAKAWERGIRLSRESDPPIPE